ncbi:hypothetical protein [Amycolatopsis rubida]|uniref:Uncharacterized protein n=1 Tax=Amycolatopsis rubida TaxID=112413 RepID=A0A1I5KRA2_9PSEU|nr:hypothetical protein [Amycolatopsis rubida]SFO87518.1 hypothetical protein SAMN05421854_103307 [Amycolatopsis rubida]
MAERVGIPAARDSRDRLYGRAAIDATPPPFEAFKPLRCGGCAVAVIAVSTHPRRTPRGGTTQVTALYRLPPNGEHDPGCPYDFKNRAENLIRDSRGTLVKDGEDYELRLPDPDTIEPPDPLPPSKPGKPTARLAVTASPYRLVPALSTAAGIVRLLREFDDDPDASSRFRARYAGRTLRWNEFCRGANEAVAIAGYLGHGPAARHPLALHGIVRDVGTAHSRNTHQLRDEHEDYLDHAGERRRLRVVVRSRNPGAFAQVRPGDRWLGYGHWKLWPAPSAPVTEVQLWIDGPWSLTTWREDNGSGPRA